ncbi:MAG: 30S ribosomal protein S8 [Pseudomonadota bacterium]
MSLQDPISDMITRIRNAQMVGHKSVTMPSSKHKIDILKVMQAEGYIEQYDEFGDPKKQVTVTLRYFEGKPVIVKIDRISRPSLRKYSPTKELPKVLNGLGVLIVSTSKGVMTDTSARNAGLGGEVICSMY